MEGGKVGGGESERGMKLLFQKRRGKLQVHTFSGCTEMQWLARTQMALHNNLE